MVERSERRWIRTTLWVGLAMAAVWAWLNLSHAIRLRAPEESRPASPLVFLEPDGRTFALRDLEGEVVVINLWASWCAPCRAELPRLARLHRDLRDRGLRVVGLNAEGLSPAELVRIRREWEIPYPIVLAAGELSGTTFEGEGLLPHTWLVDRAGRVRASRAGLVSERSLRSATEQLLDEEYSDGLPGRTPGRPGAGH